MLEKLRIKEHMEVVDADGQHVGTVDKVEDDKIKLTKTDSSDEKHHFLSMEDVDRLEDNRVYLKQGANIPDGSGANT